MNDVLKWATLMFALVAFCISANNKKRISMIERDQTKDLNASVEMSETILKTAQVVYGIAEKMKELHSREDKP